MRCVKLTYQKRWDFLHSSKILSISCCLDLGGPRASAFIWFFHAQLNIFNYVEVGALCWPWQDTEFETFGTKDCGFSFLLVFLQTLIVLLSFDSENQHSSEKNNILPVFQLPVSPGFGPLNTFFLCSNETNGFLFLAWRTRIAVI